MSVFSMYNIPANTNLGTYQGNATAGYCDTAVDTIAPYKENMFWNILYSYRKYNNESATIRNDICKEMKIMQMDVLDYLMTTYDLAPNQLLLLYLSCTDEFYKKLVKMVAIKRIGLHE